MNLRIISRLICMLGGTLLTGQSLAMGAGDYYYVISERCQSVGLTQEQRDEQTPDVLLFEVDPANISDYSISVNNDALHDYTAQGIAYLNNLQANQIYTVGSYSTDTRIAEHRFLLQKEIISYQMLAGLLSRFSESQTDKGHYFRQLLSIENKGAQFLAVTEVKLVDERIPNRVFLSEYASAYFLIDADGKPENAAVVTVSHLDSLTSALHPETSQWKNTLRNGVCAEKPAYAHW